MLTGCAPLILARTPKVLEEGQRKTTIALGANLAVGPQSVRDPPPPPMCCADTVAFRYSPLAIPFTIETNWGLGDNLETGFSIGIGMPMVGFRLGAKALLLREPFPMALDAGASVYPSNAIVDAGLLMAFPQPGWEPYLGLRGFYAHYWGGGRPSSLTGAITVGVHIPYNPNSEGLFIELTLATAQFDHSFSSGTIVNTALYLIPAIGFRF